MEWANMVYSLLTEEGSPMTSPATHGRLPTPARDSHGLRSPPTDGAHERLLRDPQDRLVPRLGSNSSCKQMPAAAMHSRSLSSALSATIDYPVVQTLWTRERSTWGEERAAGVPEYLSQSCQSRRKGIRPELTPRRGFRAVVFSVERRTPTGGSHSQGDISVAHARECCRGG
jgi:hypothetical protein